MNKIKKIISSEISGIPALQAAAEKIRQEQPLLKDRKWLDEGLDEKLEKLNTELSEKSYKVSSLNYFYHWQDRYILSAQLSCRDLLVHQSLCTALAPFFEESQYEFATYKPKEIDPIIAQCRRWKKENNFVLGLDIRQFFLAISHERLLDTLSPRIKDEKIVWLLSQYLQACDKAAISFSKKEENFNYTSGFSLPIGLELSYILANAFLQEMDKDINSWNEDIVFARYIDDFLFFGKDENILLGKKEQLEQLAGSLGLQYNSGKTIFGSTTYGFEYLGCDF